MLQPPQLLQQLLTDYCSITAMSSILLNPIWLRLPDLRTLTRRPSPVTQETVSRVRHRYCNNTGPRCQASVAGPKDHQSKMERKIHYNAWWIYKRYILKPIALEGAIRALTWIHPNFRRRFSKTWKEFSDERTASRVRCCKANASSRTGWHLNSRLPH